MVHNVASGNRNEVARLIIPGTSANRLIRGSQEGRLYTLLYLAPHAGHRDVVALLLDRNAIIDARDFGDFYWTVVPP